MLLKYYKNGFSPNTCLTNIINKNADDDDNNNIINNNNNNNNSNNNNNNNFTETRKYWVDVQLGIVSSHRERDPI